MPRAAAKPKTEATPKADPADPLADLRAPVGDPDPADQQADSSAAPDEPKADPKPGEYVLELDPSAVAEAVAALHGDRYLSTSLHRGGVCACQSLVRKTLAVFERRATIVQVNNEAEGEAGAAATKAQEESA